MQVDHADVHVAAVVFSISFSCVPCESLRGDHGGDCAKEKDGLGGDPAKKSEIWLILSEKRRF